MGAVSREMEKHGTSIRRGHVEVHRDQAIVERFNRILAERVQAPVCCRNAATEGRRVCCVGGKALQGCCCSEQPNHTADGVETCRCDPRAICFCTARKYI